MFFFPIFEIYNDFIFAKLILYYTFFVGFSGHERTRADLCKYIRFWTEKDHILIKVFFETKHKNRYKHKK